MSQAREKKTNGLVTRYKILKKLAKNEEVAQYYLPTEINITRRQVVRCIRDLEKKGLIYLKRRQESGTKGVPKNIWSITFYGLMEVLKFLNNKEIEQVAYLHRDKWLVFSELPFILNRFGRYKKPGTLIFYETLRGLSRRFNSLLSDEISLLSKKEIEQIGFTPKEWASIGKRLEKHVLEQIKQSCTNSVLALEFFNDPVKFFLHQEAQEWNEETKKQILLERRLKLAGLSKNEALKKHIIKQFKNAKKAFNYLELLKLGIKN